MAIAQCSLLEVAATWRAVLFVEQLIQNSPASNLQMVIVSSGGIRGPGSRKRWKTPVRMCSHIEFVDARVIGQQRPYSREAVGGHGKV